MEGDAKSCFRKTKPMAFLPVFREVLVPSATLLPRVPEGSLLRRPYSHFQQNRAERKAGIVTFTRAREGCALSVLPPLLPYARIGCQPLLDQGFICLGPRNEISIR